MLGFSCSRPITPIQNGAQTAQQRYSINRMIKICIIISYPSSFIKDNANCPLTLRTVRPHSAGMRAARRSNSPASGHAAAATGGGTARRRARCKAPPTAMLARAGAALPLSAPACRAVCPCRAGPAACAGATPAPALVSGRPGPPQPTPARCRLTQLAGLQPATACTRGWRAAGHSCSRPSGRRRAGLGLAGAGQLTQLAG